MGHPVADDVYVLTDCPRKLQAAIDIFAHFGKRYRVIFNSSKTRVTVTGSKTDMQYYQQISMWTLNGDPIDVTVNMQLCRASLFPL